ncbi:DDE family transposase [Pseudonocardia hierapolitana]|uniref:DDE family transposase n=2 Tax=Pseudonocardia hierapolitana TaxID=1128676 RepID=A0A561T5E1_9PSEU|nr:DDE family transposase [Pseudonocardia hierapolitana]
MPAQSDMTSRPARSTATVGTRTITRAVTVAAGVFAPGHLGELTSYLPFELVDDVLAETRTVQRRLRELPSRAGVYFVLALGLFPRIGYARVWAKLCAGLSGAGLAVPAVSEKALRDLRRRLGPAPLKALFEVVAGPLAQPRTPGTCFAGLRTVAFDGLNSLKVPDTDRNRSWMGRIRYRMGFAGYPTLRLMCLAETGTRGLLGATIGAAGDRDEATLALRLLPLLRPGMLLLLDRGFDAATFLTAVARTGAMLLARARSQRVPPVLTHLPDGSYLSDLDGLAVRIIEADLTMRGADGTRIGDRYRLITTLLDHRRYPADALIQLYHERWEIESAYLALRHTMLDGHVLRSGDRAGLEQEVWALLTLYQLLRMAMTTAVETRPGTNPDRASFTTALETARDQLTAAAGIYPEPTDLLGVIGQAVLATLLPARRARYSARKVKCATSRYLNRDDGRPTAPTAITTIDILMHTPAPDPTPRPRRVPSRPRAPRPPTRRARVTALLGSDPRRAWSGTELAQTLQVPKRNMLTQLAEWTRLGLIARTNAGSYALDPPPPPVPPPSDRRSGRREERGTVEPRQHSADEQPRPTTDTVHAHRLPGNDTPTPPASWT